MLRNLRAAVFATLSNTATPLAVLQPRLNTAFVWASLVVGLCFFASCAKPVAVFKTEAPKTGVPTKVAFKNESQSAKRFEWDFGDKQTSTEKSPTHEYREPGSYTITLTAFAGKKKNQTSQQIRVTAPIDPEMYNYYNEKGNTFVTLETTFGNIRIMLFNSTPKHRDNFIKLVKEGYFDDLLFHRVIKGFMIQGGDPNSRGAAAGAQLGMGGPSYRVPAEFRPELIHVKGALAAARTGGPMNPEKESSGSQFYIVQGSPIQENMVEMLEKRSGVQYTPEQRALYAKYGGTPQLDHEYTVFGQVVEGLDVIDKIAAVKTAPGDRPVEDVKMKLKAAN